MDTVLMIILMIVIAVAIIIYPKKDTFIEKFKVKGNYKSFELEICTKEKSVPPTKDEHSTSEN